ncbi:MAG: 3-phosphoshikimate 1-carboxyvinyltransferase [Candidatus Omnitrophica bacterium]|nr:3-phosphoshikimate 1-carboxyvinyltransferase [Candidatus Omnitrophota bacterium]
MAYLIKPCKKIQGVINNIPGDKSISHRAVIISSIAKGNTLVENFSYSDDCEATLKASRLLGIKIKKIGKCRLRIYGKGLFGLSKPVNKINLGESGTSMRLLIGLLSGQNFNATLEAKGSLRKRPMLRVIQPLRLMAANIKACKKGKEEFPPVKIYPSPLKAISWRMSIPSAQVKSAILLAGLYAKGRTKIYEPIKSRDHTERMLKLFGADIKLRGKNIYIRQSDLISPKKIYVPSDISSASFFMVLASLLEGSRVTIENVSLNPSRRGVIDVLKKMGADIKVIYKRRNYFEPMADLVIKSSKLKGIVVREDIMPRLIDELPVLMVAASLAKGRSVFEGIAELRVKETDRIKSMAANLSRMGVKIKVKTKANKEIIVVEGAETLKGASLKSFGDHRTAMSMIIAALCANSPSRLDDIKCISKSFPDFLRTLYGFLRK